MPHTPIAIMWFRRDLRLTDNAALYHALRSGLPVLPVFIFDKNILDDLEDRKDRRVEFIHQALEEMQEKLVTLGSTLDVRYGEPTAMFKELLKDYSVQQVFTNHDYEAYAQDRDIAVEKLLQQHGTTFHHYKDQVIFEKTEVVKEGGKPYAVFTPYSRRWKAALQPQDFAQFPVQKHYTAFLQQARKPLPTLASMGFEPLDQPFPGKMLKTEMARKYSEQRDFPAIEGTSRLGVHLRFGTISIRHLVARARELNDTYLNELIWREFYQMVLWNFPQVSRGKAFRAEYDLISWRNNEAEFTAWREGRTGYPIVDAGMRELNATGYMHNRVRMIVASFLTKHLLIDWRWGEAYFAKKLLDYDFAANNGGWQWASGSGCDAAPYFRIFNPYLQAKKFDPQGEYIRKWVPELDSFNYPIPIVDHEFARKRCLEQYSIALKGKSAL
ncbi:cryptochrome/photolyase family protein [Flavihumibacter profundi]|uniref:cryptochrome/photolyase family protein n=1 Tax=Flavihumibacter profundi TaxID=2716883 RepID=UPI001CC411ED|nr:deoxyribodipyrimidine photo-lyase [Flavihumibacter profundi]MBZ5857148.1 DNA photolyase family protein [Flavihumibacter profundi]